MSAKPVSYHPVILAKAAILPEAPPLVPPELPGTEKIFLTHLPFQATGSACYWLREGTEQNFGDTETTG